MGFAEFNLYYMDVNGENFYDDVATTIHEILHGLYFNPSIFQHFPKVPHRRKAGKMVSSVYYKKKREQYFMRGTHIMEAYNDHVGCTKYKPSKNLVCVTWI